MTKSQRTLALLVILIVVMIAFYAKAGRSISPLAGYTSGRRPVEESPSPSSSVALAMPERLAQREAQRQRVTLLAWGRDPFSRGTAAGQVSGLSLSGILWDASAPIAIINGQMVHVGEQCEGYRVTEITRDRVSVTDGTDTVQLRLAP